MSALHLVIRSLLRVTLIAGCLGGGCARRESGALQGYVEGEFVYVSSAVAGALETLAVERGAQVTAGAPLYELESGREKAAREEAARQLEQGRAALNDARKGKRPPELEAIEAQLQQARAALGLAEKELARQTRLYGSGSAAVQELERARSTRDQDAQRVSQLEADLKTAQLGLRSDQIAQAQANVQALEAALAKADWDLAQTRQAAPQAGLIFDTLYRPGEWVAAGRPVVVVLPPQNIKVRAFVPETKIGAIHVGDRVQVSVDGQSQNFAGRINFISPRAEFTPPVIYSQDTRGKLVFMIEAVFEPATAALLHPGQPVDVRIGP